MQPITALLLRQLLVWRKNWIGSSLTNFINPALFLYAFGFGLGSLLATMRGVDYLSYIVPGLVAYSVLFSANFDTTINAFSRFKIQRTYDALLATPVRLHHIILSEALWAGVKASVNGLAVLLVGALFGGVESISGAFIALPVMILGGLSIGAIGLMMTSYAKAFDFFSYIFTLWVTPNFLFTGVFFGIDRYPDFIQFIGMLMPVYHMVEAMRPALVGHEVHWLPWLGHMAYFTVLTAVPLTIALRRFNQRLFS